MDPYRVGSVEYISSLKVKPLLFKTIEGMIDSSRGYLSTLNPSSEGSQDFPQEHLLLALKRRALRLERIDKYDFDRGVRE